MEVTRRRGRRRKKLLDDLKDRRGYCHLKEEALDHTIWRNRFRGGFGPVVRQNTEWMNEWMKPGASCTWRHQTTGAEKLYRRPFADSRIAVWLKYYRDKRRALWRSPLVYSPSLLLTSREKYRERERERERGSDRFLTQLVAARLSCDTESISSVPFVPSTAKCCPHILIMPGRCDLQSDGEGNNICCCRMLLVCKRTENTLLDDKWR